MHSTRRHQPTHAGTRRHGEDGPPSDCTGETTAIAHHQLGDVAAHAALRRYLSDRPKSARLVEIARALRVAKPVTEALRVLQA